MTRYLVSLLCIFSVLAFVGCGKRDTDVVFNTSTESYPVSTDADAQALAALGATASGISVTSVVRIQMQGIGDTTMESMKLNELVLQAKEGDVRFVQLAKCYVQPRNQSSDPVLVGTAKAEDVTEDGKNMKFHVDSGPELASILKSPFTILIEIEGDAPPGKVSVSAELKLKAHIRF